MKKEEFIEILEKHGVPQEVYDEYWGNFKEHSAHFGLCSGTPSAVVSILIETIKEKNGSFLRAPW